MYYEILRVSVATRDIGDGEITTNKIARKSIDNYALGLGAVDSLQLDDGVVTSPDHFGLLRRPSLSILT